MNYSQSQVDSAPFDSLSEEVICGDDGVQADTPNRCDDNIHTSSPGEINENSHVLQSSVGEYDQAVSSKTERNWWLDQLSEARSWIAAMVRAATCLFHLVKSAVLKPVTHKDHECLAKEREQLSPLANALLSLANEATRTTSSELWVTSEGTQLAVLGLLGGVMDSYMFKVRVTLECLHVHTCTFCN